MIASHYAEPLDRSIAAATMLRNAPSTAGEVIGVIAEGEPFAMVEDSVGWAWGYAGKDRRVGYVPSEALRP